MNRRKFFRKLGIGVTALTTSPLLAQLDKNIIVSNLSNGEKADLIKKIHEPSDILELTDWLFPILKENGVPCFRVDVPTFEYNNKLYVTRLKKLITIWNESVLEDISFRRIDKARQQLEKIVGVGVSRELKLELEDMNKNQFGIYKIRTTPRLLRNDGSFNIRGIVIQYARI